MFSRDLTLAKFDADLFAAMEQEAQRQEEHIELIASENYTSPAVMEAQGSGGRKGGHSNPMGINWHMKAIHGVRDHVASLKP